jgi:hypothetical protein
MTVAAILVLNLVGLVSTAQPQQGGPWSLDDLARLVGGTWIAETKTAAGAPAITEVVYRWASGRKAIAYSLVRRDRATGAIDTSLEGLCGWHPEQQRVVLWEIDSQGSVTEGVFGEGGRLDEVIHAADGTGLPVRSVIARKGDHRFLFTASIERGGEWITVFEADYSRKGGSGPRSR